NTTSGRPAARASTRFGPGVGPSVSDVEASPVAPVTLLAGMTEPPPLTTDHCTSTPLTGLSYASVARTTSGAASVEPAVLACPSPAAGANVTGGPGFAVPVNSTGSMPGSSARTVCGPAVVPSVHAVRAMPSRPVRAVAG